MPYLHCLERRKLLILLLLCKKLQDFLVGNNDFQHLNEARNVVKVMFWLVSAGVSISVMRERRLKYIQVGGVVCANFT